MVDKNEKAPDFCLKDQTDNNVCLRDYKGKWVVLYFYPKDNTPGCTLEARYFSLNADKFEKTNAKIIGMESLITAFFGSPSKVFTPSVKCSGAPSVFGFTIWQVKHLYQYYDSKSVFVYSGMH